MLDSEVVFVEIRSPFLERATEHVLVAVSICRIDYTNMKKLIILFFIVLAFYQCTSDNSYKINKNRANDPWVFRSVLDQIPRVITIALDSNAWVSYYTDKASMYKVWNGGVSFEGAVYDYAHGPQPSSYGYAYTINEYDEPWSIVKNGNSSKPEVDYKGHRFKNDRVYINYNLIHNDGSIVKVSESPEVLSNEKGQRIFSRKFDISGLDKNTSLLFKTNISSSRSKCGRSFSCARKWCSTRITIDCTE